MSETIFEFDSDDGTALEWGMCANCEGAIPNGHDMPLDPFTCTCGKLTGFRANVTIADESDGWDHERANELLTDAPGFLRYSDGDLRLVTTMAADLNCRLCLGTGLVPIFTTLVPCECVLPDSDDDDDDDYDGARYLDFLHCSGIAEETNEQLEFSF